MIVRRNFLWVAVLALFAGAPAFAATGPCGDGIPCITGYTPGTGANDSKSGDATCDGDFMNQMYSRAYMESERSLTTRQAVIHSPDSVLQYTCFDKLVSVTAKKTGDIFSDSKDWHNKIVDISAGLDLGFLGQDFIDAISGFADDLISKMLSSLLPRDLINVLNDIGNLANLDPDELVHALGDLAEDELNSAIDSLSIEVQLQIKSKILSAVPPSVLRMISANPGGASAEELILGLQHLPPGAIEDALDNMSPADFAALINTLPTGTLNSLSSVRVTAALNRMPPGQRGQAISLMNSRAAQSLPPGVVADALADMTPAQRQALFDAMDAIELADTLASLSPEDIKRVMNGISREVQAQLRDELIASLPPEVLDALGDVQDIADIINGIRNIDPRQIANMIGQLTADQLRQLLSSLGLDQLFSLFGGADVHIELNVFMGDDNLDKSLEHVVLASLKDYTDANFDFDFLGGTAGFRGDNKDTVGDGKYACSVMQDVWQLSHCGDAAAPGEAGMQDFDQLATSDPRQSPKACGGTMISPDMQAAAENKDGKYVKYDKLEKTYVDRLGDDKNNTKECGGPISVGSRTITTKTYTRDTDGNIQVKNVQTQEKACSNPSCHYDAKSDTCEKNP